MTKRKRVERRKGSNILFLIVFLLGFAIAIYPLISRYYYRMQAKSEVQIFEEERVDLADEEVLERLELAVAYNETLDPSKMGDPYTKKQQQGIAEYARMLEIQEKIGHVHIPAINEDIPIYAGTREAVLQKGAGHLEGTSLPIGGINTHTVITAHRGLPTAKLFTDLDKLKIGDRFYIYNIADVLAYEVDQILVVEPSDFEEVLVKKGEDFATLLTCTPYMINSQRLLIRGQRVPYVQAVQEQEIQVTQTNDNYRLYFYLSLAALITLLFIIIYKRQRRKRTDV